MENGNKAGVSKPYLFAVLALSLFLPALSALFEWLISKNPLDSLALIGKWFIFWAVGVRLLMAGLRQVFNPAFTAKDIFHINHAPSHAIVRELGFANICFGLIGAISLFLPAWRMVSAFGSGLYYGIAGVNHFIRKGPSANETVAMISDIFIFLALAIYVVRMI
jgi:hypothetical protein